jgi:hypothetical protein
MRRLACTLVVALAVVLFWPAAAQAKAPGKAVLTGPGLDGPLTVSSDGMEVWGPADPVRKLCDATGFCATNGLSGDGAITDPVSDPPAGALGPEYVVDFDGWGLAAVYPFAEGGPWTKVSGQLVGQAGWVRAEANVVPLLRDLGVPLDPPAPAAPAPAAPAPSAVAPGIVTAGVVAIVLVPLAILLLRRRRRFA